MAEALKCDACGNYFEYSDDIWNKIHFFNKDVNGLRQFNETFDICPECVDKVKNILKIDSQKNPTL